MLILKKAWLSNDIYSGITTPRVLPYLAYLNYERRKPGIQEKRKPLEGGGHLNFTDSFEMVGKGGADQVG